MSDEVDEVSLVCPHCGSLLEATELERQRALILVTLAHEINTPLTGILADSENLLNALQQMDSELKNLAEHSLNQVQRLQLLTETTMATLSGRLPRRTFTIHSIYRPVNEACLMFESEAAAKGCRILEPTSTDSEFPDIEMSLFDLTLAFKNIIHNAVKYSYSAPRDRDTYRYIRVTGRWVDDEHYVYSIRVDNYGVGISEEEIEKRLIFQPFYGGNTASHRYRTGLGLGLAHARQIVEDLHHGSIDVCSRPLTNDAFLTTFIVTLPIRQPQMG